MTTDDRLREILERVRSYGVCEADNFNIQEFETLSVDQAIAAIKEIMVEKDSLVTEEEIAKIARDELISVVYEGDDNYVANNIAKALVGKVAKKEERWAIAKSQTTTKKKKGRRG